MTHTQLVRGLIDYIEMVKNRLPITGVKTASGQVRQDNGRWFSTGRPGWPDVTCCVRGRFVGLEAKTGTGKQSKEQKECQEEIERAGGLYFVVRSLGDVKRIMEEGWR